MGPRLAANPGRLGAAAQWRCFPSASGSQMVHKVPLPLDSTNWAMIVNTSGNWDPARINFKMLRTESLEKKPVPFSVPSTLGGAGARDCVADFSVICARNVPGRPIQIPRTGDLFPGYTRLVSAGRPEPPGEC